MRVEVGSCSRTGHNGAVGREAPSRRLSSGSGRGGGLWQARGAKVKGTRHAVGENIGIEGGALSQPPRPLLKLVSSSDLLP